MSNDTTNYVGPVDDKNIVTEEMSSASRNAQFEAEMEAQDFNLTISQAAQAFMVARFAAHGGEGHLDYLKLASDAFDMAAAYMAERAKRLKPVPKVQVLFDYAYAPSSPPIAKLIPLSELTEDQKAEYDRVVKEMNEKFASMSKTESATEVTGEAPTIKYPPMGHGG